MEVVELIETEVIALKEGVGVLEIEDGVGGGATGGALSRNIILIYNHSKRWLISIVKMTCVHKLRPARGNCLCHSLVHVLASYQPVAWSFTTKSS